MLAKTITGKTCREVDIEVIDIPMFRVQRN